MKRKYIQKLQNKRLRRIRTGFRRLLIKRIVDIQIQIQKKKSTLDTRDPKEDKEYQELLKEWWKLERLIRNGTAKCPVCNASDKNMTFTPILKMWLCNECYQVNQQYYKKKGETELFP